MDLMYDYVILETKYKFKAITSKELREQIRRKGVCPDCKKPNTGLRWCNKCSPGQFLKKGKTSGNSEMDELIYEAQLKTVGCHMNLEWIPYNRLQDVTPIGEGGFATIFSATWLDGKLKFRRKKYHPIAVALKKPKNSKYMTEAFINEIKIHNKCCSTYDILGFDITQLYGITKDPQTEEFMMVLAYAKEGSLRKYLENNFSDLKWKKKLFLLESIINNLEKIHKENYIHKDLHSGNILQFDSEAKIADLGLAQLMHNSKSSRSSSVCGVLPYISPEILDGKPYTFASDIYSFGIIMVEVSTGKPPYSNVPHDEKLALAICNGLRPRVAKGTPQCYIDLVNKCLDANPKKRPSADKLRETISNYLYNNEIFKEFIDVDKINSQKTSSEITIHTEAIYSSRFMSFTNLSKPRNSTKVQIEDSEVPDSLLIDLHVSNEFQSSLDQDLIDSN